MTSVLLTANESTSTNPMSDTSNCFKIQVNEDLGRYLEATRDIAEGEVIIKKRPLLCGPKIASQPLCLGCHKLLNAEEVFYKCSKCDWPLCGPSCEDEKMHRVECELFTRNNHKPHIQNTSSKQLGYAMILPLRAFMLKFTNKDDYDILVSMQSHLGDIFETPLYKFLRSASTMIIRDLNLYCGEEELLKLCSIFDTNCFEIRDSSVKIRGLYPLVSLIAHDCKVNTKHSFHGPDHEIHVIATRAIKKGEMITTTYTQTLWCTLSRRAHLKQAKNFDCRCQRCSDPTELGTYAGSVFCPTCEDNSSLVVSEDPLDPEADWVCQTCASPVSVDYLNVLNASLRREIASLDKSDPHQFEDFLVRYSDHLHPNNCHVLEVKYALVQMLGHIKGYTLSELSDELLRRKISICEELLKVADVLEPGCSKFRGDLLNDLQRAMIEQTERSKTRKEITEDEAKERFTKCLNVLREATKILDSEPITHISFGNLEYLLQMIG